MTLPTARADARSMMQYDAQKKSAGIAYLLWFFFCPLGAHRFYLGKTGSAVAMLVICLVSIPLLIFGVGLFGFIALGIWAVVDAFLIPGMVSEHNSALINRLT